jgi:hypothetical protein
VAGDYEIAGVTLSGEAVAATIAVEEDHLLIEVSDAPGQRFLPLSDTAFINLETGQQFTVVLDEGGDVLELILGRDVRAVRVPS